MKGKLKKYAITACIVSVFTALAFFMAIFSGVTQFMNAALAERNDEGDAIHITGVMNGDDAKFVISGSVKIPALRSPEHAEINGTDIRLTYTEEDPQSQAEAAASVDLTGTLEGEICRFEGKINGLYVAAAGTVTRKNGKITIEATGQWGGIASGGGKLAWPAPKAMTVTSPFGYRTHPISGQTSFHSGVDLSGAAVHGTPLVAADDGIVISSGWNGGYGNCVILDHGGGYTTLYGHASSLIARKGQEVKRGETIALLGTTGYSTGPHLHFEVRINGEYQDPMPYIKEDKE